MKEDRLNIWALALLADKTKGLGVDKVELDIRVEELKDLDQLDKMIISRLINDAVWELDGKLWTLDALNASGEDYDTIEEVTYQMDIEPYMPWELKHICDLYPLGSAVGEEELNGDQAKIYRLLTQSMDGNEQAKQQLVEEHNIHWE